MSDPNPALSSPTSSPSPWVMIVGISFLGLAVVFIMALIIASIFDRTVPEGSRFLVCSLLALITSIGSGFLGGSAVASGQIPTPRFLQNPVSFGITGGIAVFIIVLLFSSFTYSYLTPVGVIIPPPLPVETKIAAPIVTNVNSTKADDGNNIVLVTFQPLSLSSQYRLFIEIAKDGEFIQMARNRSLVDKPDKGGPIVLAVKKSEQIKYWTRLVVEDLEGKILVKGSAMYFEIPSS